MSKFRKNDGGKNAPGINTSSLPDIVFMLLFFFMVATTSKEVDPTVVVNSPTGSYTTDLTPFKQRSEVDFLYLGKPLNKARAEAMGGAYALSLDNVVVPNADGLYTTTAVRQWKLDKFNNKPSTMKQTIELVITCIKADQKAPTGMIFDIRKELQDIDAISVAYAVKDNGNI